jgi:hypothetical protein
VSSIAASLLGVPQLRRRRRPPRWLILILLEYALSLGWIALIVLEIVKGKYFDGEPF